MRNVAGIPQTEAQKSTDLYMKCRYMDELTGGKGIIFATGTPISNSMSECYTIIKKCLKVSMRTKLKLNNQLRYTLCYTEISPIITLMISSI
jgi:N12 class adenine-specific DNA methylase